MRRHAIHYFLAFAMSISLAACSDSDPESKPELTKSHAHHQSLAASEAVSGQSLHVLPSAWTNQLGEQRHLRDYAGRVVVLAMVYTHCDNACPRIIADLRRIRDGLGEQGDEPVYVLVSIDTERDSVARLHQFGQDTGLSKLGWQLWRASAGTVRELAAVLGVQYKRVSDTDFAHSNLISVLDQDGVIAHQQQGLGAAPDATIRAIQGLLQPADANSHHEHH